LSITYKILFDNLLSMLSPYAKEIIGGDQRGFRCTRSTTDHVFCIQPILEKKCREAVHQLFIDFKKTYNSVRREVLYNNLTEFHIPMTLVKLIKVCLNETYSKVQAHKHLPDKFPTTNGLNEGDALTPLLLNFALEYAIRRVQVNQDGLKLNGTHQLLVHADHVNILGRSIQITKKNTKAFLVAYKQIGLEIHVCD